MSDQNFVDSTSGELGGASSEIVNAARNVFADAVRALFSRHDYPPRRQTAELSRILNISISQAARKFSGQSPWQDADLFCLVTHFGESIDQLFSLTTDISPNATLCLGNQFIRVFAQLGDKLTGSTYSEYVALDSDQGLVLYPFDLAPRSNSDRFSVSSIQIVCRDFRSYSVAVLDDDELVCASIREALSLKGYDVISFTDISSIQAAARRKKFDAYICDWSLSSTGQTSEDFIRVLRQEIDPMAVVMILTGHGGSLDAQITLAQMERSGVRVHTKPALPFILESSLRAALEARQS